jgi:hypothetical protein
MIGTFHQPHFLPWPGYMARLMACDIVILLDDVKYNKDYYHNRTIFVTDYDKNEWLTVPINCQTRNLIINSVQISHPPLFKKWFRKFRLSYENSDNFDEFWSFFESSFNNNYPSLANLNIDLINWIMDKISTTININKPTILRSSSFEIENIERTQRILKISKALGINKILMGEDSLIVHDIDKLDINKIECVLHGFIGIKELKPTNGLSFIHYPLSIDWNVASYDLKKNWGIIN